MIIPIVGYAPDMDPTTPGVWTTCTAMIPTLRGMKGAPSPADADVTALPDPCKGAAVLTELDGTTHLYAGTDNALYEAASGVWTDVSGSSYSLPSGKRWRFAQFGDVSLATQKGDVLQFATGSSFADTTSAPQGSIVEVVGNFVFLLDTNDGTFGDSPNRWQCSAIGTHNSWTASVATQAATGLLTSVPGAITAAKRFGDGMVVYKKTGMYLFQYVGPPIIWATPQLPGTAGAPCQEAVVDIGTLRDPKHAFMGLDGFYVFDGARAVPIEAPLRKEVFDEINQDAIEQVMALHERAEATIRWFYPSGSSSVCDKCVVWNYKTNKWGRDDRSPQVVFEFLAPGVTYDSLGNLYATYNDFPSAPYDKAFQAGGVPQPAIFDSSNRPAILNGASVASGFETGDYGDDSVVSLVSRVKPRFLTPPNSGSMTHKYRMNIGDNLSMDQAQPMSSQRFDVLRSARWHRDSFTFSGDVEISYAGIVVDIKPEGSE